MFVVKFIFLAKDVDVAEIERLIDVDTLNEITNNVMTCEVLREQDAQALRQVASLAQLILQYNLFTHSQAVAECAQLRKQANAITVCAQSSTRAHGIY